MFVLFNVQITAFAGLITMSPKMTWRGQGQTPDHAGLSLRQPDTRLYTLHSTPRQTGTHCFSNSHKSGYVPQEFGQGAVVPIIKDKSGNPSLIDNYRPITLSPVISNVFEHCLMSIFSEYISSDNLQLSFKRNLSCSHAVFTLRTVCDTTDVH